MARINCFQPWIYSWNDDKIIQNNYHCRLNATVYRFIQRAADDDVCLCMQRRLLSHRCEANSGSVQLKHRIGSRLRTYYIWLDVLAHVNFHQWFIWCVVCVLCFSLAGRSMHKICKGVVSKRPSSHHIAVFLIIPRKRSDSVLVCRKHSIDFALCARALTHERPRSSAHISVHIHL